MFRPQSDHREIESTESCAQAAKSAQLKELTEGEMGFEQMQLFSSEQNLCESFSRDLLYQGSSEVPAQNNWGGREEESFKNVLAKTSPYAFHSASPDVCHPRAAQSTVEQTENCSRSSP